MNRTMMRRMISLLAAMLAAAGIAMAATAAPARAQSCSPWPSCFGGSYQVTGTPDNSLTEWSNSPADGGTVIGTIPNEHTLAVGCQANNGPQEDSEYNAPGVPSLTWDFAWDPALNRFVWVYDWWMNTPPQRAAYGWYSWPDTARHCNFNTPGSPASGGAGPYQVTGADSQGLAVQSSPHLNNVIRWVPNGTTLNVACQVNNGDQADGRTQYGRPFTTWDRLTDGTWVYDWYMNTPVVNTDGFSPGMPHCNDGSSAFVALGDSYSAGLGAYSYRSDPNPDCHRSNDTYSVVYASSYSEPSWLGNAQPALLACAGATTNALLGSFTTGNGKTEPAQLFTGALGQNTKLVTISIGGNDVGFATLLAKCLDPRTSPGGDDCWLPALNDPGTTGYSSTRTGAYQAATALQSTLQLDYGIIRELAPGAHIVVIAYPQIFPPQVENCAQSLGIVGQMSPNALHAIRDTWFHLNDVIKAAAAAEGVSYLDDSPAWTGHDFCSSKPYANGLRGTWSIVPPSFSPDVESYHPTVAGYQQLASDLNGFIQSHWP